MVMNTQKKQWLVLCLWLFCIGLWIPTSASDQESLAILYIDDEADPNGSGTFDNPFNTIQRALDIYEPNRHDAIIVLDGIYTGDGNRDLNFQGKPIHLKSANGPDTCIIDCQGSQEEPQWAFTFWNSEGPDSVVEGFTITGGFTEVGSAVWCVNASPTFANCRFIDNAFEVITLWESDLHISDTVEVISGDLGGDGTFIVDETSELVLSDCRVTCFITGSGRVSVPVDRGLTLAEYALVNMGPFDGNDQPSGTLNCEGMLEITDNAMLTNTSLHVTSARINRQARVIDNNITISQPYTNGLVVNGTAILTGNSIYSQGDNYLSIDPDTFNGTLYDNQIYISMEQNGLIECRALDSCVVDSNVPYGTFSLESVPPHDPNTWSLENLTVMPSTTVVLANRIDNQLVGDSANAPEVIYIRHVEIGSQGILDLGHRRLYYETLELHPTARIINRPLLGYSLGILDFYDEQEYLFRVRSRLSERIEGDEPDSTGMMRLYYSQNQRGRAKARFHACNTDRILISFKYLFKTNANDLELAVYLSDIDTLMDYNDPDWNIHHVEVARLCAPPAECPGAYGSDRFGRFQAWVTRGGLDLKQGTYMELAWEFRNEPIFLHLSDKAKWDRLLKSDTSEGMLDSDDWDVEVHCDGICMDLDWSDAPDEEDFMIVVSGCGRGAGLGSDRVSSTYCLEGPFTADGYVDSYDVVSWDWALDDMSQVGHLCGLPLVEDEATKMVTSPLLSDSSMQALLKNETTDLYDILVLGKNSDKGIDRLKEGLYDFDENGVFYRQFNLDTLRSAVRILPDQTGGIYIVDVNQGVLSWSMDGTFESIVPPGQHDLTLGPGNANTATVWIGIHGQGSKTHGRPVLDAVIKGDDIYIVPVIVEPDKGSPYRAAARIKHEEGQDPPYDLVEVYDLCEIADPNNADNPNLSGLREIAVDNSNNVYLLNAHSHNESDMLIKIKPNGMTEHIRLDGPLAPFIVSDPLGLCVSGDRIYLTSGQNGSYSQSVQIYGFSTEDLTHQRTITVQGISHVTDISRGPTHNSLLVVGFKMNTIPVYPSAYDDPFYDPYMTVVPEEINDVDAVPLSVPGMNLSLPLSILWTGN